MPEVHNAYQCDFCGVLMEPIEIVTLRWHSKYCSKCGRRVFDLFIGEVNSGPRDFEPHTDDSDQ
jgi:hypothetical protein